MFEYSDKVFLIICRILEKYGREREERERERERGGL
jgi:hypothetical protein